MNFADAIKICLVKWVTLTGRASRSEFWFWILFTLILQIGAEFFTHSAIILGNFTLLPVSFVILLLLATLIPSFSVAVRRLHDTDRSGWWLLLYCVPVIGVFIFTFLAAQQGTKGPNQYGPDPLAPGLQRLL